MMIEPIPSTIKETLSRSTAINAMAKSQPNKMDTPINKRFFVLRNENINKHRISITAINMASLLSALIWLALSTAITGEPVMAISISGKTCIVCCDMLSTKFTNNVLLADSIEP